MNSNYKFKLPVKKFDSYVNEPNNDKHNRGVQESYGRTRLGERGEGQEGGKEGGRGKGQEGGREGGRGEKAGGREGGIEEQVREGGEGGREEGGEGGCKRETMTSRLQKAHCN